MQDKDKQYDPARHNEQSPAPGFASVNTHQEEDMEKEIPADQRRSDPQETELAGFTNPNVPLEPNDVSSDKEE
jgi:hypothetical protein